MQHTPEALREFLKDHLQYEVKMLIGTSMLLQRTPSGDSVLRNALLESHALHARVLADFFLPRGRQRDDIYAEDYFDEPDRWEAARRDINVDTIQRIRHEVTTGVVHPSARRLGVHANKDSRFDRVVEPLCELLQAFADALPEALSGEILLPAKHRSLLSEQLQAGSGATVPVGDHSLLRAVSTRRDSRGGVSG